jgi:formylglycine-generating enzyme required for sulfatase activity/serine/threonine protein kinase
MSAGKPALPVGFTVDSLRIDDVLGKGAFGITYRVTDEVIGAKLALKEFFPAGIADRDADGRVCPANDQQGKQFAEGLARFLDEGRVVAPLKHTNIVQVFRCFEANGTAYMLMPWYQGEKLLTLFKRSGAFDTDEARALALPLLDALAYLHENDVIHQDIKPDNLYITRDGDPILLDFGAATTGDNATPTGLGSEGYAAPEQTDQVDGIGPWTDIYGLAATLFRLVTGQIPLAASERTKAIKQGLPDPLPAVSTLAVHSLDPRLCRAIDAGLSPDPRQRPASAVEWRVQFERLTPRSMPRSGGDVYPREGREWLPMILLSIFGILVVAALVYLLFGNQPDRVPGTETDNTPQIATPVDTPSDEETARWREALSADTLYAYRRFISDYPASANNIRALERIDVLDEEQWAASVSVNTLDSYLAYVSDFPAGLHEPEASIRIDRFQRERAEAERLELAQQEADREAWAQARSDRTLDSVNSYLDAYPDGLHVEQALELKRRLQDVQKDRLAFDSARKIHKIAAYQTYLDAFPQGRHVAAALQAIDDLTLRPGKAFRDCEQCPEMMVVPAGSFWQGSEEESELALSNEKPRRRIAIGQPFAIGVSEITMMQWDQCVDDGGCQTRPTDNGWGRQSRPVIMVSWNDAMDFADWLGKKTGQSYRLPSESEWEYAARAGEESDWLGGDASMVCRYGNVGALETEFRWRHEECNDGTPLQTDPVAKREANAFGLYDVIGNVAEWTLDCMTLSYIDARFMVYRHP